MNVNAIPPSGQALLIPAPTTPEEWCDQWRIPLLDEIPFPGLATSKDVRDLPDELSNWPGANDPRVGAWLYARYAGPGARCADPFYGAGQLWLHVPDAQLEACELEPAAHGRQGDARFWEPSAKVDFVDTSPPFPQNHDSGKNEKQVELVQSKGWGAIQAFGSTPGNLANMTVPDFWVAMRQVYERILSYLKPGGHLVVILRNYIRNEQEVDWIGRHVSCLRGLDADLVGAHPRRLRPVGPMQIKVSRDPRTPWTKLEWAVVCR